MTILTTPSAKCPKELLEVFFEIFFNSIRQSSPMMPPLSWLPLIDDFFSAGSHFLEWLELFAFTPAQTPSSYL